MKKIKLDPFTIALIVLVLLIVFSLAGKYFNSVKTRVSELEKQIRHDLKLLKLTKQRQEELTQKAIAAYRIVISAVFLVFITLISVAMVAGMSYIDALEIHLGTAGIMVTAITAIFYHTWNPDVLLNVLKDKIKEWIYKKNGFDPTVIDFLQSKINIGRFELEEVRMERGDNNLTQNALA